MKNFYKEKDYLKVAKNIFRPITEYGGGLGYRFEHSCRVLSYAKMIVLVQELKNQKINVQAVYIAALFHDIGDLVRLDKNKFMDYQGGPDINIEVEGARLLPKYIGKITDSKTMNRAQELIAMHFDYSSKDIENWIIQDADNLDELGLLNLWRMFTYSSAVKRSLNKTLEFWEREEFKSKKNKVLKMFHFKVTKQWALIRLNRMTKAMDQLKLEHLGSDFRF